MNCRKRFGVQGIKSSVLDTVILKFLLDIHKCQIGSGNMSQKFRVEVEAGEEIELWST